MSARRDSFLGKASEMFVRFVVGTVRQPAREQCGILVAGYDLLEDADLERYEWRWLRECLSWFEMELPVPPYQRHSWSERASCWFHDSARDMIRRARDIAAILELHQQPVRMLRTRTPGAILYEDSYQIVAVSRRYGSLNR